MSCKVSLRKTSFLKSISLSRKKLGYLLFNKGSLMLNESESKLKKSCSNLWTSKSHFSLLEYKSLLESKKAKIKKLRAKKVNKILFFHDLIENYNHDNFSDKTDKELQLKDVNNQPFNDIKDEKVREIFINIKKKIDTDV